MAAPTESSGSESTTNILSKIKENVDWNAVYFKYLPIAGATSYVAFSANIMNQRIFYSLFGHNELVAANMLWFNSHLGVGLYLYNRRHMKRAERYHRIMYSVFGSSIFNFGSVLMWATTGHLMPDNNFIKTLFGVLSGVGLLYIGKEYLDNADGIQKGVTLDVDTTDSKA